MPLIGAKWIKTFCLMFAAASLTSLSTAASWAQGRVVMGSSSSVTMAILGQKIIPDFEKKHNVRVEIVPGSSVQHLARIQAQAKSQELDVVMLDDLVMHQALQLGACGDLPKDVLAPLDPKSVMGSKAVGMGFSAVGLVYNSDVFAKRGWNAPTSWLDLGDPRFKGQVSIAPVSNSYGLFALIMLARSTGGSEKSIDSGFAFMKEKVAPNVSMFENTNKLAEYLQTGEVAMTDWANHRTQDLAQKGAPVKYVTPKEGAINYMSMLCAVAGAPNKPMADALIAAFVSEEAQTILADKLGLAPTSTNVKLPGPIASKVLSRADTEKLIQLDWDTINKSRADWTKRWSREIER